jgi:hypothetical protein
VVVELTDPGKGAAELTGVALCSSDDSRYERQQADPDHIGELTEP